MALSPWDDEQETWDVAAVAAVRDASPISDVIGEYEQLQSAGGEYLRGQCPFCETTAPTLSVATARGLFYCFECSRGGDVFSFVSQIERVSKSEAVERLATRAGIVLP